MAKYKVGDKVKALTDGGYWGDTVTVGKVYSIKEVKHETCYIINTNTGDYLAMLEHELELVETKDRYEAFRNLPIGTKVALRDDLVIGNRYPTCRYTPELKELVGSILVIAGGTGISGNNYFMKGQPQRSSFSSEMIDRVITEVITEEIVEEIEEVVEEAPKVTEEDILHNHYFIDVGEFLDPETGRCIIDVYVILEKFKDISPAMQHVVKKALVTGGRGSKDYIRDLQDIIDTAEREKVIHSKR